MRRVAHFIEHLLHFSPIGKGNRTRKALLIGGLFLAMMLFSAFIAYLLTWLQAYIKKPLEEYALQAYLGVFVVSLLSSSTVLFPAPGLAVILAAASKWEPLWVAIAAATGGSLGELVSYSVGYFGSVAIMRQRGPLYVRAERWTKRYGVLLVFLLALIPMALFDIAGIVAGALRLPVWRFLLATFAGRLPQQLFMVYVGLGLVRLIFPFLFP